MKSVKEKIYFNVIDSFFQTDPKWKYASGNFRGPINSKLRFLSEINDAIMLQLYEPIQWLGDA